MSDASRVSPEADSRHEDALREIKAALGQIQYGSIVITIHQGEVVAVETSTKVRLKRGGTTSGVISLVQSSGCRSITPGSRKGAAAAGGRAETKRSG